MLVKQLSTFLFLFGFAVADRVSTAYLQNRLDTVYLYDPIYQGDEGSCSCLKVDVAKISDALKEHYGDANVPQLHVDVFSTKEACLESYSIEQYHYCLYQGKGRSITRKLRHTHCVCAYLFFNNVCMSCVFLSLISLSICACMVRESTCSRALVMAM